MPCLFWVVFWSFQIRPMVWSCLFKILKLTEATEIFKRRENGTWSHMFLLCSVLYSLGFPLYSIVSGSMFRSNLIFYDDFASGFFSILRKCFFLNSFASSSASDHHIIFHYGLRSLRFCLWCHSPLNPLNLSVLLHLKLNSLGT